MGCGGSAPAVEAEEIEVDVAESGVARTDAVKISLNIAEADSTKAKPSSQTFVGSVLLAREKAAENADVMLDCAARLQAYNRRLKEYVAIYDAETVNEAMNGGLMGLGCNDAKLIAAMCTRTKSQLQRTKQRYRDAYDKDLREEVMDETEGGYKKLCFFTLAAADAYIADIIDMACNEAAILEFGEPRRELDAVCPLELLLPVATRSPLLTTTNAPMSRRSQAATRSACSRSS